MEANFYNIVVPGTSIWYCCTPYLLVSFYCSTVTGTGMSVTPVDLHVGRWTPLNISFLELSYMQFVLSSLVQVPVMYRITRFAAEKHEQIR